METTTGKTARYHPITPADIAGVITAIRCMEVGPQYLIHFAVKTDDGQRKYVNAWSETQPPLRKGKRVRVTGRVIYHDYRDSQGNEKTLEEIMAGTIYTR